MQEIVDTMTAGKAHEILPGGMGVEGEIVGGNEIVDETDEIACRIGDVHVSPQL